MLVKLKHLNILTRLLFGLVLVNYGLGLLELYIRFTLFGIPGFMVLVGSVLSVFHPTFYQIIPMSMLCILYNILLAPLCGFGGEPLPSQLIINCLLFGLITLTELIKEKYILK